MRIVTSPTLHVVVRAESRGSAVLLVPERPAPEVLDLASAVLDARELGLLVDYLAAHVPDTREVVLSGRAGGQPL